MNQAENGNEPTKEVKAVTLTCGQCKVSPAVISTSGMQMGPLTCQIFFCGACGTIFNIQVMEKHEIRLDRLIDPRIVGGGRI